MKFFLKVTVLITILLITISCNHAVKCNNVMMNHSEFKDFLSLPEKQQTKVLGIDYFKDFPYQFILYKPTTTTYHFPMHKINKTYQKVIIAKNIQNNQAIHSIGRGLTSIYFGDYREWTDTAVKYFNDFFEVSENSNEAIEIGFKVISTKYEYGNVSVRAYVTLEATLQDNSSVRVVGISSSPRGFEAATDGAVMRSVVNLLNNFMFYSSVNSDRVK